MWESFFKAEKTLYIEKMDKPNWLSQNIKIEQDEYITGSGAILYINKLLRNIKYKWVALRYPFIIIHH